MKLLVSNVGSTSLKFKLFDMPEERVLCEAKIERVGSRDAAIMSYRSHLSGARFSAEGCASRYAEGIALFLEKLTGDETGVIKGVEEISAIGFKTVLSRGYYGVHELTDEVMENMREYLYIAPVHNAAYIEAIGQFKAVLPDVPMIGVFETAFHREIPLSGRCTPSPTNGTKIRHPQDGLSRRVPRVHRPAGGKARQGGESHLLPPWRKLLHLCDPRRKERGQQLRLLPPDRRDARESCRGH